jgi:integrase/recombinase XerD
MLDTSEKRGRSTQSTAEPADQNVGTATAGSTRRRGRRAMPRHKVLSLDEITRIYDEDCQVQGPKPATIAGYQRTLRCYLRWATSEQLTTLPQFTAEAVKRFIAATQQRQTYEGHPFTPAQQRRVSGTTVRNYTRDLKAFASWLERETYTSENVLSRVRKPKADEVPVAPFCQEELDRIFATFDLTDAVELRDYDILHTLWDTGKRCGELVSLTFDDVDLKQGEIRIDHAKWGKWRDIGFGKQTQKYLPRYLSVCRP